MDNKEKARTEVFERTMELIVAHTDTLLTMLKLFESLALDKARKENERLVMDDDIIAMLGMQSKVSAKRVKVLGKFRPFNRISFNNLWRQIEQVRDMAARVELKKQEELT